MELTTVSIIILNYNGQEHAEHCLTSLAGMDFPSSQMEIIVVDNASTDGSVELIARQYPHVRLIRSATNLGFSQGANLGASVATGKYLAFLNNDMRVSPTWLGELVKTALADEQHAVVGSAILNWEGVAHDFVGRPDDAFCLANAPHPLPTYAMPDGVRDFLFVSAGAALVRADAFRECGGFDPDYFMYHEDVDLGWRLWLRGYRCALAPQSITYHRGGASSGKLPAAFIQGMAQKHVLFTLFKNLEADTLKELLPLVFYVLLERGRWAEPLRVSLAEAVEGFLAALESLLDKRAEIQRTRVVSDDALFSKLGHPFEFLLRNERYRTILRRLLARCSKVEIDLNADSAVALRGALAEWLNAAHFTLEHDWILEINERENERATLSRQSDELNEAFAQSTETARALSSQVDALSGQLAAKEERFHALTAELAETKSAHNTQLAFKEQQFQALTDELAEVNHAHATQLTFKEQQLQALSDELAQTNRAHATQLATKEQQLQTLAAELAETGSQLSRQLVTSVAQTGALTTELDQIKSSRGWRWLGFYWDIRLRYLLPAYRWLGFPVRDRPPSDKP